MPTYIGENKIVDRYVGDKLVVAAYKGESKYFDAYSEITGTLPLIFKSRAAVALKNYRIYGTSEGAGVETENLFDKGSAVDGYWLQASNGAMVVHSGYCVSDYIPIVAGETYFSYSAGRTFCWYDQTKSFIETSPTGISATAPQTASFLRVNLIIANKSIAVLTNFSTAPASYIPYGYKLPLTITSREQSQDYPLYIGSTKLGEEEYVDYEEQKVWKFTPNLYDVNNITEGAYVHFNDAIVSDPNWAYTDFISVDDNTSYTIKDAGKGTSNIVLYDANKRNIGYAQQDDFIKPPENTAYVRFNLWLSNKNVCVFKGFQPTDPPVPLPAISTYQGENTLSSTETLGEATVKGRIEKIILITPDLVQGSIDYWPYTIGQKGTRASVTTRCSMQTYVTIPPKSRVYISADKDDVVFSGCWTDINLTYQGTLASGFNKKLVLENTELSDKHIVLNSIGRMLPTDADNSPTGTIAPSYFTITFKIKKT